MADFPRMPYEAEVKYFDFTVIKYGLVEHFPKEILDDLSLEELQDGGFYRNEVIVRMIHRILSYEGGVEQIGVEEVPVGWWDHVICSLTERFVDLAADYDERTGFWWWLRHKANTRRIATQQQLVRVCPHGLVNSTLPPRERHFRWLAFGDEESPPRARR